MKSVRVVSLQFTVCNYREVIEFLEDLYSQERKYPVAKINEHMRNLQKPTSHGTFIGASLSLIRFPKRNPIKAYIQFHQASPLSSGKKSKVWNNFESMRAIENIAFKSS